MSRLRRRLGGAEQPGRPVDRRRAAALARSNSSGCAADAEPEPGLGLVAVVGERADADVAAVLAAAAADAGRGGHGDLAPRVGVVGVVDADARVGGERQALELLGQLDLARRSGTRPSVVVPQRLRRCTSTPSGSASPAHSSTVPNGDVVARLGEHLVDGRSVERAGVGEAGAAVADDADADALALGRHEVLDLALVDADLGLAAAGRRTPRSARRAGPVDDPTAIA